jgi:hypothetical protein
LPAAAIVEVTEKAVDCAKILRQTPGIVESLEGASAL